MEDFKLSEGIEVVGVNTVLGKEILDTKHHIPDILITHWETKEIEHDSQTPIRYKRINHKEFKYQIHIKNPRRVKKKVLIRLWLGILNRQNDIRVEMCSINVILCLRLHTQSKKNLGLRGSINIKTGQVFILR